MSRDKQKREDELMDELLEKYGATEEGIFGKKGIVRELTKRLVERALSGELTHHLGYAKGEAPEEVDNHRNGYSAKRLKVGDGEVQIAVPRDREGSFEPVLVRKGQRRFAEFDQRIIAMYGRGMTVREIQDFLEEQYGVEVSAEFISTVTDSVLEEVKEWQNRPLESVYPVVLFDALRVRIRDEGVVKNKAVYLALGTRVDGRREVLGLWIEQNEGAKFWLKVMNELKNRGVNDVLIAVVDGLKGFPEAIRAVYPQSQVQTCIVHLIRYSLSFCSWKERKAVAAELKKIYRAHNAQAALEGLEEFEASELGRKYVMIGQSWRRAWEEVIPFLSYPQEIRRSIYTTNAIESLHMQLRKVMKNRGQFPSDEAASKLIYLGLRNITAKWQAPSNGWREAALQFAILFGERFASNRLDGGCAPPNPAPLAAAGVRGEQPGAPAPCPPPTTSPKSKPTN
jgi:transposase-like protein